MVDILGVNTPWSLLFMGYRFQTAQEIALATDRWVRTNKLYNTREDACRRWVFPGRTDLLCYTLKKRQRMRLYSVCRKEQGL